MIENRYMYERKNSRGFQIKSIGDADLIRLNAQIFIKYSTLFGTACIYNNITMRKIGIDDDFSCFVCVWKPRLLLRIRTSLC